MFVPDGAAPGLFSRGRVCGRFRRDTAIAHAAEVGTALARGTSIPGSPVAGAGRSVASTHLADSTVKQFVDLQNDVASSDVALAARENYVSVEHLKRYTTMGMGTDQGKTSNINALVLMAEQTGRTPPEVGTTKFRPPFAPVSFGMLVGRRTGALYRPMKRLPGLRLARGAWRTVRRFRQLATSCRVPRRRRVTDGCRAAGSPRGSYRRGNSGWLTLGQAGSVRTGRGAVSGSDVSRDDVDARDRSGALRLALE